MNLEDSINGVIQKKLSDGTIENIIATKLEKGINEAMDDLFRSYGDVRKVIKEKVASVMVPAIEGHDFSDYLIKLDTILTEIVNNTSIPDNRKILENFKTLMIEDTTKCIAASELFEQWCDYVAENVSTRNLEVYFEDGPTYEPVDCSMHIEYENGRSWSNIESAKIIFECDQDEEMNFCIPISRWKKFDGDNWDIDYKEDPTINSLRFMNDFEIILLRLKRSFCKLTIDTEDIAEEITIEAEPEASFS